MWGAMPFDWQLLQLRLMVTTRSYTARESRFVWDRMSLPRDEFQTEPEKQRSGPFAVFANNSADIPSRTSKRWPPVHFGKLKMARRSLHWLRGDIAFRSPLLVRKKRRVSFTSR